MCYCKKNKNSPMTNEVQSMKNAISFFFFLIILLIYLFLAVLGSSSLCVGFLQLPAGATLPCSAQGFLLQRLHLLWSLGSGHMGFSSCGTQAQLSHGIWDLPGPESNPCIGKRILIYRTTREVQKPLLDPNVYHIFP